jgi:hypothetical protein
VTEATPHPLIAPLEGLLGTWRGRGHGRYPSIADFDYDEDLRFWHTGRPWIGYEQRTRNLESGAPMHSELGYWRSDPEGRVEIVLAHAFGIAELQEGRIEDGRIEVESKSLSSTSTANVVEAVTRTFELDGDRLTYSVEMAFGDQPLQNHLSASLQRV